MTRLVLKAKKDYLNAQITESQTCKQLLGLGLRLDHFCLVRFHLNLKPQLLNHYSKRPALIPTKWRTISQSRIFHFYQRSQKNLSCCRSWIICLPTISHINFNLPTVLVTVQTQLSPVLSMTFLQLLMPSKFLSWISLVCRLLLTPLTTPYCWGALNNVVVLLVRPSAGSSRTCQTGFVLFPRATVTPSYPSLIMGCHKGRCWAQFCLCCTHNLFRRS